MSIKSIGPRYAYLLHQDDVGVKSPEDLLKVNAVELYEKLRASNDKKYIVKILPTIPKIEEWIREVRQTMKDTDYYVPH